MILSMARAILTFWTERKNRTFTAQSHRSLPYYVQIFTLRNANYAFFSYRKTGPFLDKKVSFHKLNKGEFSFAAFECTPGFKIPGSHRLKRPIRIQIRV